MSVLVTGASGQLGSRVVELLLEAGTEGIIAGTRNPEKLQHFAEQGVEVRTVDFDDPAGMKEAFTGVDRLLLISTDAVDGTDKRLGQHKAAVQAAQEAGVKHVVYTSLTDAFASAVAFAGDHAGTEQALIDSTMGFTISRNNVYMDMLPGTIARALQSDGKWYDAAENGKVAYITREDCARVAAAALASDFSARRTLEVSGAEALSREELAAIAGEIAGAKIEYISVPLEAVIDGMASSGLPRPLAEIFASFDSATAQGTFEVATTAVEVLTGQKPTSIREFLTANKAAFAQA